MADRLRNSALPHTLSEVVGDLADLLQKELRLARAELSEKLSIKLRAGVWMSIAGVLGLITVLLIAEAVVFGIATWGIPLHWSCLIVAGVLALAGAAAYAKGKANAQEDLAPTRTIHQVKRDIATAKEQLT